VTRAVDPDSLNADPDPVRIQGFHDRKLKEKKTAENFFYQKLQFTYVQATGEAFNSQKRTCSTSKNEIYIYVCGSFLPSWIRIANPDTDPGTLLDPDPIRIRIHSTAGITHEKLAKCLGCGGGSLRVQLGRASRGRGEEILRVPDGVRGVRGRASHVQGAVREGQGAGGTRRRNVYAVAEER
jgi:hypothetical protein